MKRADVEKHCEELVMPIIEENNYDLVDVEYVKEGSDYFLRVYVDKEGGIFINDCVLVSRALEAKLDEADYVKDAYILEVSSPGLTRPLKKDNDLQRNLGKMVEMKLYKSLDGIKEFEGILKEFTELTITLTFEDGDIVFNRSDISMIRLAFVF